METLTLAAIVVLASLSAYLYGVVRSLRQALIDNKEYTATVKAENNSLYAKLLSKNGMSPLSVHQVGAAQDDALPMRDKILSPNVVLRRQAEERASPEYLDKAGKILKTQ